MKGLILQAGVWSNKHKSLILSLIGAVVIGATLARFFLIITGGAECQ